MKLDSTYKLTARKEGTAVVTVSSKILPNKDAEPMEMPGMKMKMSWSLSGSQKGTMQIDERTGWTKEAEMVQEMSGTIRMEMARARKPTVVPVEIKSTIRIRAEE